jgi:uncharacterized protein (DUF58 family)
LPGHSRFGIEKEAWLRFFGALGGLTLAFLAAVFSTVVRQEGRLWATAALASASLLIAGGVAITIVPYLARRVALERVRYALDYDLTREGMIYLAMVLLIGIAALNTGNNLLFIIVAVMLAAVLVSGVVSGSMLRALELDVMLPAHIFAGSTLMARFTVRNTRRLLPCFSVSVVPTKVGRQHRRLRWERTAFVFPMKAPAGREWLRLPDLALRWEGPRLKIRPIFSGAAYFPYVPARSSAAADVELLLPRRGRYAQEGLGLATRFPFSFLVKTRRVELKRELIVYPSVEPTDASLEVLPMITGEFETFVRGRGYDLYRIREYMPEDSARHVDWKATAKTGELKVREFTREDERKLRIAFDNPPPGLVSEDEYEQAIALTASLGWHFAGANTELSFAGPGYSGSNEIYDFLKYLALLQPTGAPSVLDTLELTDDYNLIITARPRGSIPTALWACSYLVFINGSPSGD